MSFWKHIGVGLAKAGGAALKGAKWASQNPEVAIAIAVATGHPEDAKIIGQVAPIVNAVLPQ